MSRCGLESFAVEEIYSYVLEVATSAVIVMKLIIRMSIGEIILFTGYKIG